MCEEFFNVGILDPDDFDLASFEFGQSEYDNEEPTYPTALSCDPRGASYAEKRSNARGIPTLLSPDYLVSEENDLRSVMVVEVLLNVAPLPDQALGPHSVEAEAYGKKLRGLVYLAFKESNITMPFKMGRHNNGELTNGDLVDFMIELDGVSSGSPPRCHVTRLAPTFKAPSRRQCLLSTSLGDPFPIPCCNQSPGWEASLFRPKYCNFTACATGVPCLLYTSDAADE